MPLLTSPVARRLICVFSLAATATSGCVIEYEPPGCVAESAATYDGRTRESGAPKRTPYDACTSGRLIRCTAEDIMTGDETERTNYVENGVKYLDLEGKGITSLAPGAFSQGCEELGTLDLSDNQIQRLEGDTFVGLPALTWLEIGSIWVGDSNPIQFVDINAFAGLNTETQIMLDSDQLKAALKDSGICPSHWLADHAAVIVQPCSRVVHKQALRVSGRSRVRRGGVHAPGPMM